MNTQAHMKTQAQLLFPQARQCPYQPSKEYADLGTRPAAHKVRLWNDDEVWLVTGHEVARDLLSDARLSADRSVDDFPVVLPRFDADIFKPLALIGSDAPRHDVHRKLVAPYFNLKQARVNRPGVEAMAHELIDKIEEKGGTADLLNDYALPIPSKVVSDILGVPYRDHDFFESTSAALLQAPDAEGARQAGLELMAYLEQLIATEESVGAGEGLIAELVAAIDDVHVTRDDAMRIALALLLGGHDTTAQMIALGVITLLAHPLELARVQQHPHEMPAVVDELLRMISVTDVAGVRVARSDIRIGDITIESGDGLIFSSSMINRDESVWSTPFEFAPWGEHAASARRHLTFGYGPHQCLGQNFARMELDVAFTVLFSRLPNLQLAVDADAIPYRVGGTMQGVHALPVTW